MLGCVSSMHVYLQHPRKAQIANITMTNNTLLMPPTSDATDIGLFGITKVPITYTYIR